MALKFTVHVVQSFIKGHRKSGVISIKHSRDMTNRISPLTVEYRIRVKFGGDKKLTVWRSDLEPPIIMSANYFNLGGGADHSSWQQSQPLPRAPNYQW